MQDKSSKTVCFTGHREIRASDEKWLREKLKMILIGLIERGYCFFGAGGARGFDALAAEVVLELKELYPKIYLILVLPFYDQYQHENSWSRAEVEQYISLREKADKVVHLSDRYCSGIYYRRNRHLVDGSSVCVCYQYKDSGGTAYTTKYALGKGIKVINCIEK